VDNEDEHAGTPEPIKVTRVKKKTTTKKKRTAAAETG
jgi:hypothetical protein